MGVFMHHRVSLRIEDDLRDPEPIPEVDKKKVAVIAPVLHPSHQMDALADLRAPKLPAGMRSRRHDASLPPTLTLPLEGGGAGRGRFPEPTATALKRWISASVRNRYSPGGSHQIGRASCRERV